MKAKYRLTEDTHQSGRGAGVRLTVTLVEPALKMTVPQPPSTWPNPPRDEVSEPLNSVQYYRMPVMRDAALKEGLRRLAMGLDCPADNVEWELVQ